MGLVNDWKSLLASGMNFAHWTITLVNQADAEDFITDIPAGTDLNDAKAILATVCGVSLEKTSTFGYEEEWPTEIKNQFIDPASGARRWSWPGRILYNPNFTF